MANFQDVVGDVSKMTESYYPLDVIAAILSAYAAAVVARAGEGLKTGFDRIGYFDVGRIAGREYRNPRTGEFEAHGEKSRLVFVASDNLRGALGAPIDLVEGGDIFTVGYGDMREALIVACDGLGDARKKTLLDAGSLLWCCDGAEGVGRGEWVNDEADGWVCASGVEPFVALDWARVLRVLEAAAVSIKVTLFKGGSVLWRGLGRFDVRILPAGVRSVPLWDGGQAEYAVARRKKPVFKSEAVI